MTSNSMGAFLAAEMRKGPRRNGPNPRYADTPERRQIDDLIRVATEGVAQIRKADGLTEKGKVQALARGYIPTRKQIQALEKQERDRHIRQYNSVERELFGADSASGAGAEAARQATAIADELSSRDAALTALGDAQRTGDVGLGRAIAYRAWRSGWNDVLDTYANGNARIHEKLAELSDLGDHLNSSRSMFSGFSKPRELSGLDDAQMAQHAGRNPELSTQGFTDLGATVFHGRGDGSVTPEQETAYRDEVATRRQEHQQ